MSSLTPEQIRKLPKDTSLPYNGLTREQCVAIGIDPDEVEAGRIAQNAWAQQQQAQAAQAEAGEIVLAVEAAVEEGTYSDAEGAELVRQTGNATAYDAYVTRWQEREAQERAEDAAAELSWASADEYAATINAAREAERAELQAELERVGDQIAEAKLAEFGSELRETLASTPGLHEIAKPLEERLQELLIAAAQSGDDPIPETKPERDRLVQQAVRDLKIRSDVDGNISAQVDTEWRAREQARKAANFDALRTDDTTPQARKAQEQQWRSERYAELLDETRATMPESVRELPPTSHEQTAALTAKYEAEEQKSTDLASQVAGIAQRGADKATRDRDHGATMTEDRAAYREALARAEAEGNFGKFAPVKSAYGGEGTTAPTKLDRQQEIPDEFSSPFPGFA